MIKDFLKVSWVFPVFWVLVALGSCSVSHYSNYTVEVHPSGGQTSIACQEFRRDIRIGHQRPTFPKVDVRRLTADERTDLLLSHMERTKKYMDDEERFLKEDMIRHQIQCSGSRSVIQK